MSDKILKLLVFFCLIFRSKSFSSLSLSSISTDFSESFDFAEVNPMAVADNVSSGIINYL